MKSYRKLICAALVSVALYGCGGDGGSNERVLSEGKATIVFSSISTATLAVPIGGIDFSITLPQGISVATASSLSGQIDSESLQPGMALTGTNLAFGNYSASTRKVYLSMATTSSTYRSGEFLRLVCTVAQGTNITYGTFKALNTPVPVSKVVGYDPVTRSTVDLTNNINVTFEVTQ
jgi:hypothetical protein